VLLAQQKQDEYIKQLASKVDLLTTHNKMLETQIAHQAGSSSTPPGRLPSKPEQNPTEQCNAIVLRSDTKLEGPKGTSVEVESEKEKDKGKTPLPHESELEKKRENENEQESKTLPPKPYSPPLPFPQRFARTKLESQFGKFLGMLKKLHVNISCLDALSQMPLYAKFFKEILSKRRNLNEHETVALGEEYSVVVLNQLPAKLKDPSSFSIPCTIGNVSIDRELCDLGSSVSLMPYTMFNRLGLGELTPTGISL